MAESYYSTKITINTNMRRFIQWRENNRSCRL